jgi:hypothetical protein
VAWVLSPEAAAYAWAHATRSHAPSLRRRRAAWLLERRLDETGRAGIAPRTEAAPGDPLWRALALLDHAVLTEQMRRAAAKRARARVSAHTPGDAVGTDGGEDDATVQWARAWAEACAHPVYWLAEAVGLEMVERLGLAPGAPRLGLLDRPTRDAVITRLSREAPLPKGLYLSQALEELGVDRRRETNSVVRARMPHRTGAEAAQLLAARTLEQLARDHKTRTAA